MTLSRSFSDYAYYLDRYQGIKETMNSKCPFCGQDWDSTYCPHYIHIIVFMVLDDLVKAKESELIQKDIQITHLVNENKKLSKTIKDLIML